MKPLLKFLTCGSVDDGKSTLIGRLLYDTGTVFEDQLEILEAESAKKANTHGGLDFSLLVDGLQSEREQGITIDVAYRYFATPKRKFIIADTPGHVQYTRNMVTGASNADLGLILVDARQGLLQQTKRHAFILNLLGIRQVVVVVNKMDLVHYDEEKFYQIAAAFQDFAQSLHFQSLSFIPISSIFGENIAQPSTRMPWYNGQTLLDLLENAEIETPQNRAFRFPVQYVNRPHSDFRGYAGTISSGAVHLGDEVVILPSGTSSHIAEIRRGFESVEYAGAGEAVTLVLADERDVSRGNMIAHPSTAPEVTHTLEATVVWMHETPLQKEKEYLFKFQHAYISGTFAHLLHETDVNTLTQKEAKEIGLNHIVEAQIRLKQDIAADVFSQYPSTGSFIVVDRYTNHTVAAGTISRLRFNDIAFNDIVFNDIAEDTNDASTAFSAFEIELNQLIRKHFPHWQAKDLLAAHDVLKGENSLK
jgi:sulfate adenylyltransferase subunit 1